MRGEGTLTRGVISLKGPIGNLDCQFEGLSVGRERDASLILHSRIFVIRFSDTYCRSLLCKEVSEYNLSAIHRAIVGLL